MLPRLLLAALLMLSSFMIYVPTAHAEDEAAAPGVSPDMERPAEGNPPAVRLRMTELLPDPVSPQTDADDEFVELQNEGDAPLDLTGYALKTAKAHIPLPEGELPAGEYIVVTSKDTKLVLSNGGGWVALLSPEGQELQKVEWPKAKAGQSWALEGEAWSWNPQPTPEEENAEVRPEEEPAEDTAAPVFGGSGGPTGGHPPLLLSELLPDPEAPATDANDEQVELFNPTGEPAELSGWVIATGTSYQHKAKIKEGVVPPGGYLTLRSGDVPFRLSNAGTSVALIDPDGVVRDTTSYPKASPGQVWVKGQGGWEWSGTITPDGSNLITFAGAAAAAAKTAKTPKAAKAAKKASVKKSTAKKLSSPKDKPLKAEAAASRTQDEPARDRHAKWLLLAAVGLTISYVIYEFRHDLRNLYYRARAHAGARRPAGPSA